MRLFILMLLIKSLLFSNEAVFAPLFTEIANELEKSKTNKKELDENFRRVRDLSLKNIQIEAQISSVLQQLSMAPDFNNEALLNNAKGVSTDIARAKSIDDGYSNINEEIKKTWKTR